jgi:indolepyruvate ferredoxin oxidoreductase beta subunit
VLTTTSLAGFLQLYALASLRSWRRGSLRFRREQGGIEDWLSILPPLARDHYDLAVAVAECPRLIKGYGDTHERGEASFQAIMTALPMLRERPDAAATVRKLCRAALQDDTGAALGAALQSFGLGPPAKHQ